MPWDGLSAVIMYDLTVSNWGRHHVLIVTPLGRGNPAISGSRAA